MNTTALIAFVVGLVLGGGGGYAWGWNRALHPDKVAAQIDAVRAELKALKDRIASKL